MKKCFLLLLMVSKIGFSQEIVDNLFPTERDSIVYNKNTKVEVERFFKDNLKEKYSDKEFTYIDDLEKPEKAKPSSPIDNSFFNGFIYFMQYIFPFLLGLTIVFIILKTFLGTEIGFWNFKKLNKKVAEKLIYEEENINETDFDKLLKKSIKDKNYRLATRYYYLLLLKKLSDKKEIEYHKDKTNTEYLFEIENTNIRSQFSQVSYIYSYVWYGEFPIDSYTFKTVENKYKSIFNIIN